MTKRRGRPGMRAILEEQHGRAFSDILTGRLEGGATIPELATEWGISAARIYMIARECGFATYWVKDGKEIIARVP